MAGCGLCLAGPGGGLCRPRPMRARALAPPSVLQLASDDSLPTGEQGQAGGTALRCCMRIGTRRVPFVCVCTCGFVRFRPGNGMRSRGPRTGGHGCQMVSGKFPQAAGSSRTCWLGGDAWPHEARLRMLIRQQRARARNPRIFLHGFPTLLFDEHGEEVEKASQGCHARRRGQ